ncbi:MAG: NAD(P)H-dependent oxidoreductase [Actinomycetota bacterium]
MRVLVVDGHATPSAVVEAAEATLRTGGHDPTVLRLADEGFDRYMSEAERRAYHEPDNLISLEQRRSAELLRRSEALLVISALRAGTIDPTVKSWFERVFIPEVSFTFTASGRITGALKQIRRVGMIVECPDRQREPHRRNGSTRSVLRSIRLNSARTCRSTYCTLVAGEDPRAAVAAALSRW